MILPKLKFKDMILPKYIIMKHILHRCMCQEKLAIPH